MGESLRTSRVQITPTTPADIKDFFPKGNAWRIRALTVKADGHIVGIGGIAILPDGNKVAFVEASEETCKRYPVTLSRCARRVFADIKAQGISRLLASCDQSRAAAVRWLIRLGFVEQGIIEGERIFLWQRSAQSQQ